MTEAETCVFCQIIDGLAPGRIVADYPLAVAMLPLHPAALGHTLVIPRQHVVGIVNLTTSIAHAIADAVLDIASRVTGVIKPDGINIVQSNGSAASQTVFHLHIHIVPRITGDTLPSLWPPPRAWAPDTLDEIAWRLREVELGGGRSG